MKKAVTTGLAILVFLLVAAAVLYRTPKTFGKYVDPAEVACVQVFDGNTGNAFAIDDPEEIRHIVENIQSHPMRREGISLGKMGYYFKISYIGKNGKEMIPAFILNSSDTIRSDPFFYRCSGGLCIDDIKKIGSRAAS